MRRLRFGVMVVVIGALAALMVGCAGSDPDEAKTPANAPTITNGQPPVDGAEGGETVGGEGDVAAGKIAFEATCQGCHTAGGTQAGAGPVLADRGLTADGVRQQIVKGGAALGVPQAPFAQAAAAAPAATPGAEAAPRRTVRTGRP